MSGSRICVAGIDRAAGAHVRPTTRATDPITRELLASEGGPFGVGTTVDLGEVTPNPSRPESEDHLFATWAARAVGQLAPDEYLTLLDGIAADDLQSIFGSDLERRGRSFAIEEGCGVVSLGVLRPQRVPALEIDGWGKLRLRFNDDDPPAYLGVTDVRFVEADHRTLKPTVIADVQRRMQSGVDAFLMVGLARAFTATGDDRRRHWMQVNGICLVDRPLDLTH